MGQRGITVATDKETAANRLNGVTHGLTAATIVLKGESEADFTNLLNSLEAEHDPASPTEEALVVQLAMATWRLRRLYRQEAGFYTCQLQSLVGMQKDLNLDDAGRMGHAAAWSESTLTLFNRQERPSGAHLLPSSARTPAPPQRPGSQFGFGFPRDPRITKQR